MKLQFNDVKNREKDKRCLVIGHGQSLNKYSQKLQSLVHDDIVLIGVNEWYYYYTQEPKYWVMANNDNSIKKIHEKINCFNSTVVYADSVDLTDRDFVDRMLKVDYLPYDQRHVNGHPCCGDCCKHAIPGRLTIQQELREYTGFNQSYEGGGTCITHAIALGIMLGCKEVNFIGVDLDWDNGYADNTQGQKPTDVAVRETELVRNMTINDLIILKQSAGRVGCELYNCNDDSTFKDIPLRIL